MEKFSTKRPEIKPHLELVKGNTYCIVLSYARIPLYMLGGGKAIMIDSGFAQSWENILWLLEKENLQITAVLTSHAHPDHLGNHRNLQKHFGAKLYMSDFAAMAYRTPMNQTALGLGLVSYRMFREALGQPLRADHIIDPFSKTIDVEGTKFGVLYLPGHAAEHLGFITPDNVAYLGDAVLDENMVQRLRIPYCTCVEPDLESKEAIAELHCDRYILAHNGVCDEIRPLAEQNRDSMLEKARHLEKLCRDYQTLDQITLQFLLETGGDPDSYRTVHGARRNISVFVEYLIDTDRLEVRARNGVVEYKAKTPVSH